MGTHEGDPVSQQTLWLAEYSEAMTDHRHYQVLRWTITGLTYPTAFAAIAYAGNRWGFGSGRAALVYALASLWLIAGALVFAQVRFFDRMRMLRAWDLEKRLGFSMVSRPPFTKPREFKEQPWFTVSLAIWFSHVIPALVLLGWVTVGILLVFGLRLPSAPAVRDAYALWAAYVLVLGTAVVFSVVARRRRRHK